jgi:hypothetical protein
MAQLLTQRGLWRGYFGARRRLIFHDCWAIHTNPDSRYFPSGFGEDVPPGVDGAWLVPRGEGHAPLPLLQPLNRSCEGAVGSRCGLSIAVNLGTLAGRRTFIGRIKKGTSPGTVIERAFVPVVLRSSIGGRRSSLHDFHAEKVRPGLSLGRRALFVCTVFIESDLNFQFGLLLLSITIRKPRVITQSFNRVSSVRASESALAC